MEKLNSKVLEDSIKAIESHKKMVELNLTILKKFQKNPSDWKDEIAETKSKITVSETAINDLEKIIKDENERLLIENQSTIVQKFGENFLRDKDIEVNNFDIFKSSYEKMIKILKKSKTEVNQLADSVLRENSQESCKKIAAWFYRLDYDIKNSSKQVDEICRTVLTNEPKTINVKSKLTEILTAENFKMIDEIKSIDEVKNLLKFFTAMKVKKSTGTSRRSGGNSLKSWVDNWLESNGEGTYSLGEFVAAFDEMKGDKTTKATSQLSMNCRQDKGAIYKVSFSGNNFTISKW